MCFNLTNHNTIKHEPTAAGLQEEIMACNPAATYTSFQYLGKKTESIFLKRIPIIMQRVPIMGETLSH